MQENHARPHVAHHLADARPWLRCIAVGNALTAARFVIAVPASVQPAVGIVEQLAAAGAQLMLLGRVMVSAVDANHQGYSVLFALNPVHTAKLQKIRQKKDTRRADVFS